MAHGELVIGLKLNLTLDGRRGKWAFYSQFSHTGVQHHGLFSNKSDVSVDDLESTGKLMSAAFHLDEEKKVEPSQM